MQIRRIEMFSFDMPFMQGNIVLNVPAESEPAAAKIVKDWMAKTQLELALQFPETSPAPTDPASPTFNALQLGLIEDLAKACNLDTTNLAKSIKKATGITMTLDNFKTIVPALEAIRDGKPLPNEKEG